MSTICLPISHADSISGSLSLSFFVFCFFIWLNLTFTVTDLFPRFFGFQFGNTSRFFSAKLKEDRCEVYEHLSSKSLTWTTWSYQRQLYKLWVGFSITQKFCHPVGIKVAKICVLKPKFKKLDLKKEAVLKTHLPRSSPLGLKAYRSQELFILFYFSLSKNQDLWSDVWILHTNDLHIGKLGLEWSANNSSLIMRIDWR